MSFGALPNELIDSICDECYLEDIKNLRLTCRVLCNVANGHLIPDLTVFYNLYSLNNLQEIQSNYSRFIKKLSSIGFHAGRLQDFGSFEAWQQAWKAQPPKDEQSRNEWSQLMDDWHRIQRNEPELMDSSRWDRLDRRRFAKAKANSEGLPNRRQLLQHYRDYCRLLADQEQLDRSDTIRNILAELFRICPSLSCFCFTVGHTSKMTNNGFHEGLVEPVFDPDYAHAGVKALTQLVLAAHDVRLSIKTLILSSVSPSFIRQDTGTMSKIGGFMANVRKLQWGMAVPIDTANRTMDLVESANIRSDVREGRFLRLVEPARNLRIMLLWFPLDDDLERCDLSGIVGDLHWPHLESFSVKSIQTAPETLVNFILRHKDTLKRLSLAEIRLTRGKWSECFASFAGKVPNLRRVKLRGAFEDDDDDFYEFSDLTDDAYGFRMETIVGRYIIDGIGTTPLPEDYPDAEEVKSVIESEESDDDENDKASGIW